MEKQQTAKPVILSPNKAIATGKPKYPVLPDPAVNANTPLSDLDLKLRFSAKDVIASTELMQKNNNGISKVFALSSIV